MLTEQRYEIILKLLEEKRSITVTELKDILDTSESTVRRDITALDKAGRLTKVFGGAVVLERKVTAYEPTVAQKSELNKKEIDLMDAPVSGGEPKAIDGTISVMVGGSKENFDKYYDLLMAMAGSVVYVGELGSGNVAKLANQVIVALNIAAVSEALTLAVKNDADPELVYKAIRGGLAGSTVLDAKAPMMMAHNFKPGFRIELHIKDLNNALNAGHAVNAALPLTSQVMEIMQSLKADGKEKDDHSAIVKYYEKISDTSVEKKN